MANWLNLIAIAAGGALGSVSRYLIAVISASIPGGSSMLGTAIANVVGCAAIGAFAAYVELRAGTDAVFPERMRLAIQVGFLGGLTTFSTYMAEKAVLLQTGRWGGVSLYVLANIVVGWLVLVLAAQWVRSWMN